MTFLENLDFSVVFRAIGIGLLLFWLVVLGWVVFDSSERYTSIWARIFSLLLVLLFPLFGLLIYLIIRPKLTAEEEEWSDLERRFLKFEADGLEDCNICGFELMPNYVYCPNCGTELRRKCESCEVYLDSHWRVCPFCGTDQKRGKGRDYKDLAYVEIADEDKGRPVSKPAAEAPIPAASVESVITTPAPKTTVPPSSPEPVSKQPIQTVKRRKKKDGITVKKYFEKTMLTMDGFVKYVGNIPLKAVSGAKTSSTESESSKSKSSNSETTKTDSSESINAKVDNSKSTSSKSTSSKSKQSSSSKESGSKERSKEKKSERKISKEDEASKEGKKSRDDTSDKASKKE